MRMPRSAPADGDALQRHLGFLKGQRVALDGIGMVGPSHYKLLPQVAHNRRVQRTMLVQQSLEAVDVGEGAHDQEWEWEASSLLTFTREFRPLA